MDSPSTFASPEEEAAYWKSQATDYRLRYEETALELEEFQISSRELEAELEAQLEQAEAKVRELTSANQRLQMDGEALMDRNREIQTESHRQINALADDLGSISKTKEELVTYVRELEMSNDALENSKRQTISTLEDFEQRLNQALERNAYLENELEEKDQLHATIQRLKDEARDLRLEMSLKKTRSPSSVSLPLRETTTTSTSNGGSFASSEDNDGVAAKERSSSYNNSHVIPIPNGNRNLEQSTSNRHTPSPSSKHNSPSLTSSMLTQPGFPTTATTTTNLGVINAVQNYNNNQITHHGASEALTPTARITALNIVGDLLRKVGSLESKLASCRTTSMSVGSPLGSPMMEGGGLTKQRATTIGASEGGGGGDFSPSSFPASRPRANAVSAPTFVNCENYV